MAKCRVGSSWNSWHTFLYWNRRANITKLTGIENVRINIQNAKCRKEKERKGWENVWISSAKSSFRQTQSGLKSSGGTKLQNLPHPQSSTSQKCDENIYLFQCRFCVVNVVRFQKHLFFGFNFHFLSSFCWDVPFPLVCNRETFQCRPKKCNDCGQDWL